MPLLRHVTAAAVRGFGGAAAHPLGRPTRQQCRPAADGPTTTGYGTIHDVESVETETAPSQPEWAPPTPSSPQSHLAEPDMSAAPNKLKEMPEGLFSTPEAPAYPLMSNRVQGYGESSYAPYNQGAARKTAPSPETAIAALDLPGAMGSFGTLRQFAAVVSYRNSAGEPKETLILDFNILDAGRTPSPGGIQGFAEEGRSVVPIRLCSFTLPEAPHDAELVVHLLSEDAAHVAYHNRPDTPRSGANETRGSVWPKSGFDVYEVGCWMQAVHIKVQSPPVAIRQPAEEGGKAGDGAERFMVIGEAGQILLNHEAPAQLARKEPLKANPFIGVESLLVSAFRSHKLLLSDFDHMAKLRLCWWYARKYGRDRSSKLLCANVLAYLRASDAEGLYNATEILALLHLVSLAVFESGKHASFAAFIANHPELQDSDVLLQYYTPSLLHARKSRIAFVEPDVKQLLGPLYPSTIRDALRYDSPIQDGREPVHDLDNLVRVQSVRAMTTLPIKPESHFEGYENLYLDNISRVDQMDDLGPATAFRKRALVEKPWARKK